MPLANTSTSIRWVSVPPETMRKPLRRQRLGQDLRRWPRSVRVILEARLQRLLEADRLGGDDVHQRSALDAGEDDFVDLLGVLGFRAESARRAGPRSVLCVVVVTKSACGTGLGCRPAATSPAMCAMSTIRYRAALVGDCGNAREVDDARIGAGRRRRSASGLCSATAPSSS